MLVLECFKIIHTLKWDHVLFIFFSFVCFSWGLGAKKIFEEKIRYTRYKCERKAEASYMSSKNNQFNLVLFLNLCGTDIKEMRIIHIYTIL